MKAIIGMVWSKAVKNRIKILTKEDLKEVSALLCGNKYKIN